jgi:hypothetical protein
VEEEELQVPAEKFHPAEAAPSRGLGSVSLYRSTRAERRRVSPVGFRGIAVAHCSFTKRESEAVRQLLLQCPRLRLNPLQATSGSSANPESRPPSKSVTGFETGGERERTAASGAGHAHCRTSLHGE